MASAKTLPTVPMVIAIEVRDGLIGADADADHPGGV
jgi:hypothetical protein